MADPTVALNRKMTDPGLMDLLNLFEKKINLSMNCHHLGTVQSFDPEKQTANVTINYKKSFLQRGTDGVYKTVLIDYPQLLDCPVVVLGGGGASLTFPISKGDECIVLFNDRDIDNWFQSGQVGPVASARTHSMSDGIALVGIRSLANVLEDYDPARTVLRNGDAMVGVGEEKIKISNASTTLNTLLQNLITTINGIVVSVSGVSPTGGTISATSQTALSNIATQLGGLLE